MKAKLPILLFWLWASVWFAATAQGQTPNAAELATGRAIAVQPASPPVAASASPSGEGPNVALPPPPQGQVLLDAAIRGLENRQSVTAKIHQQIDLFGKQLIGKGIYLEQRPGRDHLIRLELQIQLGEEVSSLVQVCDGHYLWTYRKLLNEGTLSRVEVRPAVQAIEKAAADPNRTDWGTLPGLGGLPRVLRGINASFQFAAAEKGRLGQLPVWILRGQWKPGPLAKIFPAQAQAIQEGKQPSWRKAPQHLPDQIIVLLGQDDLFPYRIEYHRRIAPKERRRDGPESRALVIMDLFEVSINVPIDRSQFVYNPGNVKFTDQTTGFIESMRKQD